MATTTGSKKKRAAQDSGTAGIRVIARAVEILNSLAKHQDGLTLGEIAQQVGLPRSTVQRIVKALDEANLVIAASPSSGVRLGPGLLALAASAKRLTFAELLRPLMVQLAKDTGETVDLAILSNDKAVVVDQISGIHPLVAVSAVGTSLPLHASASGKALLAALPPERLQRLKKRLIKPTLTNKSISSWSEIDREIERVRLHGVAVDREEYLTGICAVAIALEGPDSEWAAVSLPVPADRFRATEKRLVQILTERCRSFKRRI